MTTARPMIRPFTGLRPQSAHAAAVAAPPYDVLSSEEARQRAAGKPYSFLHISKAEIDLPPEVDHYAPEVYAKSAENLKKLIDAGVLFRDKTPCYYAYRLVMGSHTQTGLIAAASVADYDSNRIRKHEFTRPDKEDDRVRQIEALNAQTGPVLLAHPDSDEAEQLIAAATAGTPIADLTADDGIKHTVWLIDDEATIARISAVVGAMPNLYIADGHHRYGVSRVYRDMVRKATGRKDTAAELTLTFINELVDDQLSIEAIHRIYDGLSFDELKNALSGSFTIEPMTEPLGPATLAQMVETERLVLLDPKGEPSWLVARPGAFNGVRALDGAWLEHALSGSKAQVSYQHGLDEVLAELDNAGTGPFGGHAGAVLIRPTSLAEIERTAREGLLMPPKSTFFTPKLRTGLVIRPTQRLPR